MHTSGIMLSVVLIFKLYYLYFFNLLFCSVTACNTLSSCCQVLQNVGIFNDFLVVVKYQMKCEYLFKSNFKINVLWNVTVQYTHVLAQMFAAASDGWLNVCMY
jgi:hypothetical protein